MNTLLPPKNSHDENPWEEREPFALEDAVSPRPFSTYIDGGSGSSSSSSSHCSDTRPPGALTQSPAYLRTRVTLFHQRILAVPNFTLPRYTCMRLLRGRWVLLLVARHRHACDLRPAPLRDLRHHWRLPPLGVSAVSGIVWNHIKFCFAYHPERQAPA